MNSNFPRLLTLLRKEKKINQKKAAEALGISQALLSHYENGIRECGLDFLVKTADYYGVTCDYLLGRSASRDLAVSALNDDEMGKNATDKNFKGSTYAVMHKKLLLNSISILFDIIQAPQYKDYANYSGMYISASIYKVFRYFYSANKNNNCDFFAVDEKHFPEGITCDMTISEMSIKNLLGNAFSEEITYDKLKEQNPSGAVALFNLIRNVELKSVAKK